MDSNMIQPWHETETWTDWDPNPEATRARNLENGNHPGAKPGTHARALAWSGWRGVYRLDPGAIDVWTQAEISRGLYKRTRARGSKMTPPVDHTKKRTLVVTS